MTNPPDRLSIKERFSFLLFRAAAMWAAVPTWGKALLVAGAASVAMSLVLLALHKPAVAAGAALTFGGGAALRRSRKAHRMRVQQADDKARKVEIGLGRDKEDLAPKPGETPAQRRARLEALAAKSNKRRNP